MLVEEFRVEKGALSDSLTLVSVCHGRVWDCRITTSELDSVLKNTGKYPSAFKPNTVENPSALTKVMRRDHQHISITEERVRPWCDTCGGRVSEFKIEESYWGGNRMNGDSVQVMAFCHGIQDTYEVTALSLDIAIANNTLMAKRFIRQYDDTVASPAWLVANTSAVKPVKVKVSFGLNKKRKLIL